MISTRDKFTTILFALTASDDFKEYMSKEIHIFYSSIKDCLDSDEDWDKLVELFIDENESIINFVYSELLAFW